VPRAGTVPSLALVSAPSTLGVKGLAAQGWATQRDLGFHSQQGRADHVLACT